MDLFNQVFSRRKEIKRYKYDGDRPDELTIAMCSKCRAFHVRRNVDWEVVVRGNKLQMECVNLDDNDLPT